MESEKRDTTQQGVREDLVKTAVQFLQNARVRDRPSSDKETFLQKKGLSDEEIRLAFERAGTTSEIQRFEQTQQMFVPHNPTQVVVVQPSYWTQWQTMAKTVVLVSGVSYGLYYIFDRYFGPLLWGSNDRLRAMEATLESLETSLVSTCRELQESLQQVKDTLAQQQLELSRLAESRTDLLTATNHVAKLEADVASVKGLLLGRRQFPTVPSTSPGIPAWQLSQDPEEGSVAKDSSAESGGDPSPVSNGTSSPELLERVDERGGSSE